MQPEPRPHKNPWLARLPALLILALALYVRTAGVHRGLTAGYTFHSDEPKQVVALGHYLNNEYIWYHGHPMFDGYPLFLSHLDEWIIRPVRALYRAVHAHINPDSVLPRYPEGRDLFRWSRTLRVLYGWLAVALVIPLAKRAGLPRGAALAAALLMALAPVAGAVTRFATGDVGTDLFCILAVYLLAVHAAHPRRRWLAASGFAVGLAFASKYNGVLVAMVTILYLAGRWLSTRVGFRRFVAEGALSFGGFLAGVVVAMPQFTWATKRTWMDMLRIFRFIRNYHVPPAIMEMPGWRRALAGVIDNGAWLVGHLGWMVVATGTAAAVAAGLALARRWKTEAADTREFRVAILRFALFSFSPLALLFALATKYRVKPFHFSYLQFGFCVAAAGALAALWRSRRPGSKALAVVLFAAGLLEFGWFTERETFFWRRDDIRRIGPDLTAAFADFAAPHDRRRATPSRRTIKALYLEADNPSGFRNRPFIVFSPDGAFWNDIHIAPVPAVPLPVEHSWIFLNGPVFPRSDRLFRVAAGGERALHLVLHEQPGPIEIGLRSGQHPALVALDAGGHRIDVRLEPNQQVVLPVTPRRWRTQRKARMGEHDVFLVPLRVESAVGDVWVNVMDDPREALPFRAFGGDPEAAAALGASLPDRDALLAHLPRTRFLESPPDTSIFLFADNRQRRALLTESAPLPAGRYRLEVDIEGLAETSRVSLSLTDPAGVWPEPADIEPDLPVAHGRQTLVWTFAKPFAPLEKGIRITVREGSCRIRGWTLAPDAPALYDDLRALAQDGTTPAWAARFPDAPPSGLGPERPVEARFGRARALEIRAVSLPERVRAGVPFPAAARLQLHAPSRIDEISVVFRLRGASGRIEAEVRIPCAQATYGDAPALPVEAVLPDGLAPGTYSVFVGASNERTHRRLALRTAPRGEETRGQWVQAGTIRVGPAR